MMLERILIVDGQEAFARLSRRSLEHEGFEVKIASTRGEALNTIAQHAFELVLLDPILPDAHGVDVLRQVQERNPSTQAILLCEQQTLPVDAAAELLKLGVIDIVVKPCQPVDIVERVLEAVSSSPDHMIWGDLRELSLPSVISLLCNEGRTVQLQLWHEGHVATIYFDRGEMIHAELGDKSGEAVIYQAVTWNSGRFAVTPGSRPQKQTIHTSWSRLVLEGLRRLDEAAYDQEQLHEAPEPAPPPVDDAPSHRPRTPSFAVDDGTQRSIEERLDKLYFALQPRCVLLTTRSGLMLHAQGDVERSRTLSLAALAAGTFSANQEVAELLARQGEVARFERNLQEGHDFDLYSVRAGPDWILVVVFEPKKLLLGLARQLTLEAADDLISFADQVSVESEAQQEVAASMDEFFRQEVGDVLEDLFD